MTHIAVPATIADVDAAWLTRALAIRRPEIVVQRAELVKSLGGACTKLRMAVETNDPSFPSTIIVKACLEPHTLGMAEMQYKEACVYDRITPRLDGIETVTCFYAQADRNIGSALVMEDLDQRDVTCLNARNPIASFAVAADFLSSVASLHAMWWNANELADDGPLAFAGGLQQLLIPRNEMVLADPVALASDLGQPRAAAISNRLHDGARLGRAFTRLRANEHGEPSVFAHGDLHLSNLYLTREGRAGLLDWTPLRVPWAFDVAYFLGGCLDPIDRRRWEQPLLQHYLSKLENLGIEAPSFDAAWDAYRRWMLWGLYVWLFNIPAYHSEENITAMTARYGTAMVDLDTLGRIGC